MSVDSSSPHDIMQQTDFMKQRMADIEQQMHKSTFRAKSAGIQVTVNGDGYLQDILMDPGLDDKNIAEIFQAIVSVANLAKDQAESARQRALLDMAQELSINADAT